MSSINYSYFFQVELLHKYFANGFCNDFTIIPSAKTQVVLRGNKMIAKQYGNKLYTGIQVEDADDANNADKPFITPSADLQLTFFLQLNNPLFFNYTNLPFTYQTRKVYYFTNRNNNVSNGKNFLSQFVPYDNNKAYLPGDLAPNGAGLMFQCISSCTGIAPSAANSINWMRIDINRYMSESDALHWIPSVSTYSFDTPQENAVINVLGFNTTAGDYSTNVFSQTVSFDPDANVSSFTLKLSLLPPGKYQLTINGVEQWIYINDELRSKPVYAVIDIFNDISLAANYALLDSSTLNSPLDGSILKSPLYSINFLNRATIWKYILKNGSEGVITAVTPESTPNSPPDESPDQRFPSVPANIIISKSPIPLSEKPLDLGLALSKINTEPQDPKLDITGITSASPQRLTTFLIEPDTFACSEIFLNY